MLLSLGRYFKPSPEALVMLTARQRKELYKKLPSADIADVETLSVGRGKKDKLLEAYVRINEKYEQDPVMHKSAQEIENDFQQSMLDAASKITREWIKKLKLDSPHAG